MAPSHYLNQCWNIVNWTLGNKLQWNLNQNPNIFIQENAFENGVCEMASICLGLNELYWDSLTVVSPTTWQKLQPWKVLPHCWLWQFILFLCRESYNNAFITRYYTTGKLALFKVIPRKAPTYEVDGDDPNSLKNKTAISVLLMNWRYHSLALNEQNTT